MDRHLAIGPWVGGDLRRRPDEPDDSLERVSAVDELGSRGAEFTVDPVPREGPVPDLRLVGEGGGERSLPADAVTRRRSIVEQEQVPPPVVRVPRRADGDAVAVTFHDPVRREGVDVGRPDE